MTYMASPRGRHSIPTFGKDQKPKENNDLSNKIELLVFRKVEVPKKLQRL